MDMKKICLSVLLISAMIFSGASVAKAAQGEVMRNAQLVSLLSDMLGIGKPANADSLTDVELFQAQANLLAEKGFTQFVNTKPNAVVTKGALASLIYTALSGRTDITPEEAINTLSESGFMDTGGKNETVFVSLARTQVSERMTNEQLLSLLYSLLKMEKPESFEDQIKMLDEECIVKLENSNPDTLISKRVIADLLYNIIVGCNDATIEQKLALLSNLGYMDVGGLDDPISLGFNVVAEAYPGEIEPPPAGEPPPEPPPSAVQ